MKKIEFNHNWICKALDADDEGIQVTLPHDAMITEPRSEQSRGIHNIGWFEAKDYEYIKQFAVPKEYQDKCVYFEIEGAYRNAEIYLNGEKIGYRPFGYSDFFVEATAKIKCGEENEIRIKTYNSDQPNSRWYTGTGLYRPVNMFVCEKEHVLLNSLHIRTLQINPAVIAVDVQTTGEKEVTIEIRKDGQLVASEKTQAVGQKAAFEMTIPDAAYWSPETPELYECTAIYEKDKMTEKFGIRTLAWTREHGFTINEQRVILRGACIHHDNGVLGACAYKEAEERKIRILQENGYNAIRSAHNPCSKALLEACDRLGMLVMDEYVDVWYIHKTMFDYANYMQEWWKTDLLELVEKDYNHPSVIMYSTGNEVAETARERGIALTGEMTEYLHSLDPTRPVSCGINVFFNFLSSIGFGVYSDDKAKKEVENTAKKKKPVGSEFYNTLAGLLGDNTMKVGAMMYPCDLKTREAYANMDIAGYNYGIFRYGHDLKKYPKRLIVGSETFCKDAYSFWEKAKKNPGIVGDFVWAGMDYIGEAGIGAWEYSDYAPKDAAKSGWLTAGSGRIDILGNPNGEALYTRVALEQSEEIYLAVKPVYQTGSHSPSAWKMTEAIPNWSYPGCEGYKAKVEVYARAARVDLLLNGQKVGSKKLKNTCRGIFTIKYQPGTLEAVAYDHNGTEQKRCALVSAGTETNLSLIPEQISVSPEGLAYIQIQYTDQNGILKPMEKHQISVQVEHGTLKGLGNACPYNPDGYRKSTTKTYYGRALAVVWADGSDSVKVTVTDETRQCSVEIPCTG